MKIVHFAPSLKNGGGIASVVEDIMLEFQSNVDIHWFKTIRGINTFVDFIIFLIELMLFRLRGSNYCIHVHSSLGHTDVFRLFLIWVFFRRGSQNFLLHLHNANVDSLYERTNKHLAKIVLKNVDRIYVLNIESRDVLTKYYGINSMVRSNPARNYPHLENITKEKLILFVGAICKRKGADDLIDALALLNTNDLLKGWRVLFVGEIMDIRNSLPSYVEHVGVLPRLQVIELIAKARCLILPSYHEGQPMVVMEALALGCVPIISPAGAMSRLLELDDSHLFMSQPGKFIYIK
jgi:glycosyltransferase involved in cell wall biosynthesis